ncbi:transcription factor IIIB 50 kDa subunit-like isoform X2 [Uloborus diversus]|nr:transcription factor IIIB 50 kDa subunit-like isoform X2 [Uloborus diversus]
MDSIKCEKCGEMDMEEDQICHSCGFCVDEWTFQTDVFLPKEQRKSSAHNGFGPPRLYLKNKKSKSGLQSPSFKYGMDVLENLCRIYTITKEQQTDIESLFQGAYFARNYRHRKAIEAMVGCCVNQVLNINNVSASLTDLCSKLKCDKKTFFRSKRYFDNWYTHRSVNETSSGALSTPDRKFQELILPTSVESHVYSLFINLNDKDKPVLVEKTKQLVKLANACWLCEGRNPYNVVVACAFLCWKSLNLGRRRTTFQEFYSELSLSGPSRASKAYDARISEITNVLLKLGGKIPTYSNNSITKKNVLYYLDYILENFETLCNDLFKVMSQEAMDQEKYTMFRNKPSKKTLTAPPESIEEYDSDKEEEPLDDEEISSYLLTSKQKTVIDRILALK